MNTRIVDPRATTILFVFDRHASSPAFRDSPDLLDLLMHQLVSSQLNTFDSWPSDAVRGVLLAFIEHAPDDVLTEMADVAREQIEWLANFEDDPTGDIRGYSLVTGEARERTAEAS